MHTVMFIAGHDSSFQYVSKNRANVLSFLDVVHIVTPGQHFHVPSKVIGFQLVRCQDHKS